jgi:hypothetical protein
MSASESSRIFHNFSKQAIFLLSILRAPEKKMRNLSDPFNTFFSLLDVGFGSVILRAFFKTDLAICLQLFFANHNKIFMSPKVE